MSTQLELGDIKVDVVQKDIKNVHLSVNPPTGKVRISAPSRMSHDAIRSFAISKLGWIKDKQQELLNQERESPREFLERESHYVWGRRYLLVVSEDSVPASIELKHGRMLLTIRPGTDEESRRVILEGWYREQIRKAAQPLLAQWAPLMGVEVERYFVRRMKTKWGSCNPSSRTIRLNTELAKKPPECLEYIIVHELAHLIEPTHNERFVAVMDRFMPQWEVYRQLLNRLPIRREKWSY